MRRLILLFLFLVVVAAGACGGGGDDGGAASGENGGGAASGENGGGAASGDGALLVEGNEYTYKPSKLTAEAGTVTFALQNTGTLEHDITIDDPKFKVSAQRGKSKSDSVNLEPGTYEFYCSLPGHKAAGMTGEITVE